MTAAVRSARIDEFPLVRKILARAFQSEDEAFLWDYLVAHHPGLTPKGVRVVVVEGRPVACAVVLCERVRGLHGWVDGAVVTLVACDPDLQNRGYGASAVRDAIAYMERAGIAFGVLFGHPGYYPRFGFVPVLGFHYTTLADTAFPGAEENLQPLTEADMAAVLSLYDQEAGAHPCAVGRRPDAWEWRPRNANSGVWVLPGGQGYALVTLSENELYVPEAAAADARAARSLLTSLTHRARHAGKGRVRMAMPPRNLLVRTALAHSAETAYSPAGPGMVVITRWEALLPDGYKVGEEGLCFGEHLVLGGSRARVTEMVLGYRSVEQILLLEDVQVASPDRLRRDFPPAVPKWSLAPFWY